MIEIQQLKPDESERLRTIRLAALQDAPQAFDSTFQQMVTLSPEGWLRQLQTLPTFVGVVAGADSGMARGAPYSNDDSSASLISLWVAPKARGLGVGEALINAVAAWARSEGYVQLFLDVGIENASAVALYTRKGFKPTGKTGHLPPPRDHVKEQEMVLELFVRS